MLCYGCSTVCRSALDFGVLGVAEEFKYLINMYFSQIHLHDYYPKPKYLIPGSFGASQLERVRGKL